MASRRALSSASSRSAFLMIDSTALLRSAMVPLTLLAEASSR